MTLCKTRLGALALTLLCLSILVMTGCGKPTLDSINVEPESATLTVGQTLQLQATGLGYQRQAHQRCAVYLGR